MSGLLETFERHTIATPDTEIAVRVAGEGPGLLLLHGYPQTGVMWHRVAPRLAERFTTVVPDLRGYGASGKPAGAPGGSLYSKRVMAADQVAVMRKLGFERFAVVGHDRGARVGHRLTLDHPDAVTRLAVLDIVPTRHVFRHADEIMARVYFHWFFLSQPFDLPERLIGADPEFFLRWCLSRWSADEAAFHPDAFAEYLDAFVQPETVHATCEDYRAGAGIDLEHDRADAGRLVACPLQVLWGAHNVIWERFDVLEVWRRYAREVEGGAIESGHYIAEQAPEAALAAMLPFLERPVGR
jgi:haloacetate dehalogenase